MSEPRILVIYTHPYPRRSRVNQALRNAIAGFGYVTIHDLYETYPDFYIDVAAEQARLLAHQLIVFQHPLYWYSVPALLKEWFDVVLERGWAYGEGGRALAGKHWLQVISTGGAEESYRPEGRHRFPLLELLRPFEAMAHLCGMIWHAPLVTHADESLSNERLTQQARTYCRLLASLAQQLPAPLS
jgi:putative NADPH-quinone reductase